MTLIKILFKNYIKYDNMCHINIKILMLEI